MLFLVRKKGSALFFTGASALVVTLAGCGGGGSGSPQSGGKTYAAPVRNVNADPDSVGYQTRPATVGQWFTFRGDYAARIAKVALAQPDEIAEESVQGGPVRRHHG